jgi:hypothetical protein
VSAPQAQKAVLYKDLLLKSHKQQNEARMLVYPVLVLTAS